MQRFALVIRLKPEKEEEYRRLHADCWPGVQAALKRAHIANYSIFLRDGLLFILGRAARSAAVSLRSAPTAVPRSVRGASGSRCSPRPRPSVRLRMSRRSRMATRSVHPVGAC
ncbi:L-rhamnose mutarotase [Streptomyces sp. NPDC057746]|uniref:L-rhamnose mutarotase n=1 Tax=Streptomyces sp. NPDC057746 TaxID=3346237 RepID=UPI00368EFE89